MIMLLAEKVSKIHKYFNFILQIIDLCRCCETSWNGRCCEFPLEAAKPKPKKGFFYRLFSGHNILNLILSLAKKANATDHKPYYKRKHRAPYYKVIYNGPMLA